MSASKALGDLSDYSNLTKILFTLGEMFPSTQDAVLSFTSELSDSGSVVKAFGAAISEIGVGSVAAFGVAAVAIAGVTAALVAYTNAQYDYTNAVEAASNAAADYSDAKTELESLTSEYEEQIATIEELQALKEEGDITLEQEAELENLLSENELLEKQIALQEQLTSIKQEAAASTAATAANTEQSYMEAMQEEYGTVMGWLIGLFGSMDTVDSAGNIVHGAASEWAEQNTTELGLLESDLETLSDYQERYNEIQEELTRTDLTDEERTALESEQETLKAKIDATTESISESTETLETWRDALTDDNGKALAGYEDTVEAIDDLLDDVAKIDMSDLEKELYDIENFFSGTTNSSFISDYLKDIAAEGDITEESLATIGLTLDDIGDDVSIETLSEYFKELASSASEAEDSISSVAGTVDSVEAAFETDNQNSDWEKMADYLAQASDLYDNYQVGVDEFWEAAQFMSQDTIDTSDYLFDSDAYVEAWEDAINKVNRYFDSENPLQSASNFQEDLIAAGLGTVLTDDYGEYVDWSDEFKSSADAADALGLSLEATEVLMHNLEAYGAEFDDVEWSGENLDEYQSALESIKSLYESMDDGAAKNRLGGLIENWDEELEGYEEDLSSLTQDQIIHLEFEYDLASIQSMIDEVRALINGGDASVENYATLISGNASYINTAESELGFDSDDFTVPVVYEANEQSLENLQNKLKKATSEQERLELQAQITNLQEVQKSILNAFTDTHPEINADSSTDEIKAAWEDFCANPQTLYVDAELSQEELQTQLEQLNELAEGSTIVFNGTVEVDGNELSETVEASIGDDGTITYKADLDDDGILEELNAIEDESGTIVLTADITSAEDTIEELIGDLTANQQLDLYLNANVGEDEATLYIEKLEELQFTTKVVELAADDQASSAIASVNLAELDDKWATLSADDQATACINMINALSMDDKWATLSVEDKATAMVEYYNSLTAEDKAATISESGAQTTTDMANAAAAAIAAIPDASPRITATSNVASVVSSANSSLSSISGRTVNTYVVTHYQTANNLAGTAHAGGTTKRNGYDLSHKDQSWIKPSWRTKSDENALVGEEDTELVATKDGYWYTVGENGAEFASIPKGSVVFNAHQTRRLLTNGFIDERGKAELGGTAFASGSRRLSSTTSYAKTTSSSSSSSSSKSSSSSSSSNSSSSKSSSSSSSSTKETIDWIEIAISRLERTIDNLGKTAESTYKTLTKRLSASASEISKVTEEISLQTSAYNRYMQEANSVGLSSSLKSKVQNGTIDISEYSESTQKLIEEYQTWCIFFHAPLSGDG